MASLTGLACFNTERELAAEKAYFRLWSLLPVNITILTHEMLNQPKPGKGWSVGDDLIPILWDDLNAHCGGTDGTASHPVPASHASPDVTKH